MGWIVLNVKLSVSSSAMSCKGGMISATVTVTGQTDDNEGENSYTAFIKEDHIIPDILWKSEPQTVLSGTTVNQSYTVELKCNKLRHVIGPHGSSGESKADIYAYVIGGRREGQSDNLRVICQW